MKLYINNKRFKIDKKYSLIKRIFKLFKYL